MKPTHVLRLLLRHWLVIGLVTLAVGAAVFAASATRTPQFTATSSVYLTLSAGSSATNLAQGSTYLQGQMDSYAELATSSRVLNTVIDQLHLNTTTKDLTKQVTAVVPRNTVILQISAMDPDPGTAAAIANAITTEFGQELSTVGPKSVTGTPLVVAQSIQVALPPAVQTSPRKTLDTLIGLVAGLALACLGVYLAARFDDRLRTAERVATLELAPSLGSLRRSAGLPGQELVVLRNPGDPLADDFRRLAAAVESAAGDSTALLVSSANRSEGRTVVAANLAAALAERGNGVLLIEGDLRNPRLAELTGAASEPGVIQALIGQDAAIQQPDDVNFAVLPAGGIDTNPVAGLSGPAMRSLIDGATAAYDVVVVDAGPLLPVTDAIAVGKHVPLVVIVGDARQTRRDDLRAAVGTATAAGLQPLGIVIDKVRPADV